MTRRGSSESSGRPGTLKNQHVYGGASAIDTPSLKSVDSVLRCHIHRQWKSIMNTNDHLIFHRSTPL
ncbi:hypothetical protein THAOC_31763 [Thalassiosira oceanica]|uniref:Uncharacterized protein n=1 Tax=Thalassiosira oceanica TaxID=159749 RepID=K0RKC7_THAOC|nr:hypothetical protein THAOC_31763 [Thalassiosira oceanica]|eukprot:EJK49366.1 hypothetical protein THAOC_31763 [Thalassiosira oceanica]